MLFLFCISLEQFAKGVVIFDVNQPCARFDQFTRNDIVIVIPESGDSEPSVLREFVFKREVADVVCERILIGGVSLDIDIAGYFHDKSVVKKAFRNTKLYCRLTLSFA